MKKYNGWTNRETWLVNLYFGDAYLEYATEQALTGSLDPEDTYEIYKSYESFLDEVLGDAMANLDSFLADFIDLSKIDWYDLAESASEDIQTAVKEANE